MKNKLFLAVIVLSVFVFVKANAEPRVVETSASVGDSHLTIKVIVDSSEMKSVESRISKFGAAGNMLYNNISQEVDQLNKQPANKPQSLSPELFLVLSEGVDLAKTAEGWFDVVQSSRHTFEFSAKDWRKVHIDDENKTVTFKSKGMEINVKILGKAFVVDKISNTLTNEGLTNHSVCIDDVICKNNGNDIHTKWSYDLKLNGTEFASRANKYWVSDVAFAEVTPSGLGKGLIDAKSGKEVPAHLVSVTALAKNATTAVAMAIGAYTTGPKSSLAFIRRYPQIKAIIITPKKEILTSLGMEFERPDYQKEIEEIQNVKEMGPSDIKLKQKEGD